MATRYFGGGVSTPKFGVQPEDEKKRTGGISNSGGIVTGGGGFSSPAGSNAFRAQLGGLKAQGQDPKPVVAAPPTTTPTPNVIAPQAPQSGPEPTPAPNPFAGPVLPISPNMIPKQPTVTPPPTNPGTPRPTTTTAGPNTGGMANDLWQRATAAMNNPSRYDADVVKQGAAVIEDTINRMRKSGMRNLGEHHASRGLIGSSLESTDVANLESELDAHAREQLSNLQREQATTFGSDRNAAFGMGMGAGGLNEQYEGRIGNEYFRGQEMDQRDRFYAGDSDYRDRSLAQNRYFGDEGLKRQDRGMDQNEAAFWADMEARYPGISEQMGYGKDDQSTTTTGGPNWTRRITGGLSA